MPRQKWQGHWMQGGQKKEMTFESLKVNKQEISGLGFDSIGVFDIVNGKVFGNQISFDQVYRGERTVNYCGMINDDLDAMYGQWSLGQLFTGTFEITVVGKAVDLVAAPTPQQEEKKADENTVEIHTPDIYDHATYPVGDVSRLNSIVFSVKAKNDAHIVLHQDNDLWEIAIGGSGNERSVIRDAAQDCEVGHADHNPLNEHQFHTFWIHWTEHRVEVGTGAQVGHNVFMSGQSADARHVKRISVVTGWGSSGHWQFPNLKKVNKILESAGHQEVPKNYLIQTIQSDLCTDLGKINDPQPVPQTPASTIPDPLPVPQTPAITIPDPLLVAETPASTIPDKLLVPQTASEKYVFAQTRDVAQVTKFQDQQHPVKAQLNWFNPLWGVSKYEPYQSYQFVTKDGTWSQFDSSKNEKNCEWVNYIVPQGKQIRSVETIIDKNLGMLLGFKWVGDDGAVLVAVGWIDDPYYRNDTESYELLSFTLEHNQRLVGVRSASNKDKKAYHDCFSWVSALNSEL